MAQLVAFLRAINVGGRTATGAALRGCFEELGFEDVVTFRNSGNVIFSSQAGVAPARTQAEQGLEASLGFPVKALLRTAKQVEAIAAQDPFERKAVEGAKGKLQVVLLERKPDAAARKRILAAATEDDLLALDGTELYWLPGAGTQGSPLGMKGIDALAGLNTVRTMGTIRLLAAKHLRG